MSSVQAIRIRDANSEPVRSGGRYVLYWMIASRRLRYNFALDRALDHCRALQKPLLVLEALRCGYLWASDRIHRFLIDGMAENAACCAKVSVAYYPYIEPHLDAGKGLLAALAADACVVITDDFPCFFLPRMVASAAKKLNVRLEAVDSNGLLPLRATEQAFGRAFDFRRFLQKNLSAHLENFPSVAPLENAKLPKPANASPEIIKRWPPASASILSGAEGLQDFPIDHSVPPAATRGGSLAALRQTHDFFETKFKQYAEGRNEPELDAVSGLSPYLHFGHISVHEVFTELARREKWHPQKLSLRANGSREGWWNMSPAAETFLDQTITWRELGYNFTSHRHDYHQFESLPAWVQKSLNAHTRDERAHLYSLPQFERAETHDPLWNAAQTQLLREGRIHNYLRMLWGKKILEWSKSPQEAARIMILLNDKYALDGRDPNSYSGIFWVLGRYDRPWAPERPIFGVIRYMSSENTARKVSVKNYIQKYSPQPALQSLLPL